MVADYLVTESMVDRFLAIDPPEFRVPSTFDTVTDEIERTLCSRPAFFRPFSGSGHDRTCFEHVTPKIKELWQKGPLNEWEGNIGALEKWGYLSAGLPEELRDLYAIRCRYLHSGEIASLEADSLRSVNTVYNLLRALIGFPRRCSRLVPASTA
jgi:hypothetical protein